MIQLRSRLMPTLDRYSEEEWTTCCRNWIWPHGRCQRASSSKPRPETPARHVCKREPQAPLVNGSLYRLRRLPFGNKESHFHVRRRRNIVPHEIELGAHVGDQFVISKGVKLANRL